MVRLARELFPGSFVALRTTARIKHDHKGRAAAAQVGFQVRNCRGGLPSSTP